MPDPTHNPGKSPQPHPETHFQSSAAVRDVVIGLSDGLTVPFALAAGLSGAISSAHIIVLAGLAEIAAGSIAMGLGGYLAARGDAEHYASELAREQEEVVTRPDDEAEEIYQIFAQYDVPREAAAPVLAALQQNHPAYVDFMMRFELGLERPASTRASRSALTIAASYIAGGLVPLLPYMFVHGHAQLGLRAVTSLSTRSSPTPPPPSNSPSSSPSLPSPSSEHSKAASSAPEPSAAPSRPPSSEAQQPQPPTRSPTSSTTPDPASNLTRPSVTNPCDYLHLARLESGKNCPLSYARNFPFPPKAILYSRQTPTPKAHAPQTAHARAFAFPPQHFGPPIATPRSYRDP